MVDVNYVFLLSLTIILLGFFLKTLNIITEENGKVIAKIIFNIVMVHHIKLGNVSEISYNWRPDCMQIWMFRFNKTRGIVILILSVLLMRNVRRCV